MRGAKLGRREYRPGRGILQGVPAHDDEEKGMPGIDWTNIPLEGFFGVDEEQEDGTVRLIEHPHGDGVASHGEHL